MRRPDAFVRKIEDRLLQRLTNAATFTQLVKQLDGTHPADVQRILSESYPSELNRLLSAEPVKKNILIETQDNPTLNSWYFTESTNRFLSSLTKWETETVALLGTPGVLLDAAARYEISEAHLFDLEPPCLLHPSRTIHVHSQNINLAAPDTFRSRFDSIYVDAPWYLSDLLMWLSVAVSWTKADGTLIASIWPKLLRPSAEDERDAIVDFLEGSGAKVELRPNSIEYEVPSFEAGQLIHKGLPIESWKVADVLIARFDNRGIDFHPWPVAAPNISEWREVQCAGIRFFLRWDALRRDDEPFLSPVEGNDLILGSPSMRAGRGRANVLSSVGHGLLCSNARKLFEVLSFISARGEAYIGEIESIDRGSLDILRQMICWPIL